MRVVDARPKNSYICNETNWDAIRALNSTKDTGVKNPQAVYFLHIPYPEIKGQYKELAAAVGHVVLALAGATAE